MPDLLGGRPPSRYDAVFSLSLPGGHAAYLFSPGQRIRVGSAKAVVVNVAGPREVHYRLIAPWWHRLWRVLSR